MTRTMKLTPALWAAALLGAGLWAANAQAAEPVVSYHFNQTLAADQASAPALAAINPLGTNGFETALVNGASQTVYRWRGEGGDSARQGGLTLDARGLVDPGHYTLAFTFEFLATASTGGGWRRLVDTEGRQSDNGLYISPGQNLQLVQDTQNSPGVQTSGNTVFSTPGFHTVLMSVDDAGNGQQQVLGWLDGALEFKVTATTTLANPNNPQRLITLFADNLAANAQQEYADGRIAWLALYDGVQSPSAVPELPPAALLAAGLLVLGWRQRRVRRPR